MQIEFSLVPSVTPFVISEKFISLIVGPVGSTKTTAGIAKIAYHAARMAPCKDGVRRSRAVWVRNTREQLRDTSIPDFQKWYQEPDFGAFMKTDMKFILRFADCECEVLFRALEDASDVRKLLSLQASFAIFEEFREINPDVFEAMQGRLGRYPDGMMVPHRPEWGVDDKGNPIQGCVTDDGTPNKHVWGMSNPPDADTYWEEKLTEPPENFHITIQPSGLSAEADWVHLLPTNYYEDLAIGKAEEYVNVYIHGKFGQSLSGKPVFQAFKTDLHLAKETLKVGPSTVVIGVDAGLTPAAVLTQQSYDGRVLVLDALTSQSMGALRFIRERLKPLIASKYGGMSIIVIIDPAAFQRAQTDERCVADIYKTEGFIIKPARTNSIAARIASVDAYLTRVVDGKSAFLVDPGCTDLLQALRGKYRYKINAKGERDESPSKDHPWSDVSDALQYACMHHDGGAVMGARMGGTARKEIKPPPFRWGA